MALLNAEVEVSFEDAGPTIVTRSYVLAQQYDTANPTDTFADIIAAADDLITNLNVLTWDRITGHAVKILFVDGGAAPNIAANNSVHAFSRTLDTDGNPGGFDVPAWDDATFDKSPQNMLSDAYNAAAAGVAVLLANTGIGGYHSPMLTVEWSQNRGSKTRNKVT